MARILLALSIMHVDTEGAAHQEYVLENLSTAVLLFDGSLCLMYLNSAAETLLELSNRQAKGENIEGLFPGAGLCSGTLRQARRHRRRLVERETELLLATERRMTVDCTITPLFDTHPAEFLVELLPVDRQKRINREEQLTNQNATARALVRRLAHEIRNPLGGLRGAAQLLDRQLDDLELREYTRVIIDEADRLQSLMDRLLGPRTVPRIRAVNVHEATERVSVLAAAESPPGVRFQRDYDPSLPRIDADLELLIQAILNVVRNAVQVLHGHGLVTIRTRAQRQVTIGQRLHRLAIRVDIQDNGPGVPEELRETLFYPMVTGRSQGTGLGLSIAQNLINQHNGLIECTSKPGETIFSILLPLEGCECA